MTDLSRILPDFPIGQYARLLPAIERQQLTTADLLTLEVADIGKRTQLPLLDVKRFCGAVLEALHVDLGVSDKQQQQQRQQQRPQLDENNEKGDDGKSDTPTALRNKNGGKNEEKSKDGDGNPSQLRHTLPQLTAQWHTISTLDETLDRALGGGIPTGRVTEITGESGVGKTQFLLTLLLAVQLPPSHGGLGRPALYISTEAPLSTVRLSQILRNHPRLQDRYLNPEVENEGGVHEEGGEKREREREREKIKKPSLDHIISTVVPDLESQDHILSFQVPVEVARRNVGLVVLDSVAANYRAEFERTGSKNAGGASGLAARSNELVRLGRLLHDLARQHGLAVVVSNQVADRFPSQVPSLPSSSAAMAATPVLLPRSSSGGGSSLPTNTMTVTQRNHGHHHHPAYMGGGGGSGRGVKQSQESPLASRSRGGPPAAFTAALNAAEPTSSAPLPSSAADADALAVEEDEEAAMAAAVAVRSSMPEPMPENHHYHHRSHNNYYDSQQQQQQPPALLLDHQQRWFTGWGDEAYFRPDEALSLKTPSLGLVWATQIAVRIALLKRPVYGRKEVLEYDREEESGGGAVGLRNWRRWMKVVFAPHVAPSGSALDRRRDRDDGGGGGGGDIGPVEFEITMGGLKAVEKKGKGKAKEKEKEKEGR